MNHADTWGKNISGETSACARLLLSAFTEGLDTSLCPAAPVLHFLGPCLTSEPWTAPTALAEVLSAVLKLCFLPGPHGGPVRQVGPPVSGVRALKTGALVGKARGSMILSLLCLQLFHALFSFPVAHNQAHHLPISPSLTTSWPSCLLFPLPGMLFPHPGYVLSKQLPVPQLSHCVL